MQGEIIRIPESRYLSDVVTCVVRVTSEHKAKDDDQYVSPGKRVHQPPHLPRGCDNSAEQKRYRIQTRVIGHHLRDAAPWIHTQNACQRPPQAKTEPELRQLGIRKRKEPAGCEKCKRDTQLRKPDEWDWQV